ncbi:MAG TPA: SdrD B-like domain-containing protein, partial [Acidimicrobiia bacterium]|nr:SdrD B-like domain-containing protein [Acidimicrobiia bacterium]
GGSYGPYSASTVVDLEPGAYSWTAVAEDGFEFTGDSSGSFDVGECESAVDIEKSTNGQDADNPTGPRLLVGSTVIWEYVVRNLGDVELTDIEVSDDQEIEVSCPKTTLVAGESMTCSASGTATSGQYANIGTVTGWAPDKTQVRDSDPSHYFGYSASTTTTTAAPALGGIGNLVWEDRNANGVQDPGEPGVAGVTVRLYNAVTDALVATQVTDANGNYLFENLQPGDYYLVFILPEADDLFVVPNAGVDPGLDSDADNTTNVSRTPVIKVLGNVIDNTWDAGIVYVAVGGVQITTTTPETLPFTGSDFGEAGLAGIALALVALGGVALMAVRRREEEVVTAAEAGSDLGWDVE